MITIDGNTIKQPNAEGGLLEDYQNYETTQVAINGSKQRVRAGQKKFAVIKWQRCSIAEYQALNTLLNAGSEVDYVNDTSNKSGGTFSFTGLPTFNSSEYWRGGSYMVDCEARIEEV